MYADALIPRGVIGRTDKVLGRRALFLLHDQQGHPLLVQRFNDRALNRDLERLCAKVAEARPRLPDGRALVFCVREMALLPLGAQEQTMARNPDSS